MKKIVGFLGLTSMLSISALAVSTPTTNNKVVNLPSEQKIIAMSEYIWAINQAEIRDRIDFKSELLNEVDLNVTKENNKDFIQSSDVFFNTKTNTLTTIRTIRESLLIKKFGETYNFTSNNNNGLDKIFNQKNREKLTLSLKLDKCKIYDKIGNTNFVDKFIGSQNTNNTFVVKYSIDDKSCKEVFNKYSYFVETLYKTSSQKTAYGFFTF